MSFFLLFFIKFIMKNDKLYQRLKQLRIEDWIWLIYIGIIFISWYANYLERKYFIYDDLKSKEKYRKIMILIFSILVIVYLYFVKDSFNDFKNIAPNDTKKKRNLSFLSFLGSFLILVSGIIFLYIAFMDEEIDIELAFN